MLLAAGVVVAIALGAVALWLALLVNSKNKEDVERLREDFAALDRRWRQERAPAAEALQHEMREEISGQVTNLRASLTDLIECKNTDLRAFENRIQEERAKIAREWKDVDERAREAHARASECLGRVFALETTAKAQPARKTRRRTR